MKNDKLSASVCESRISIWLEACVVQARKVRQAHQEKSNSSFHYNTYFLILSLNRLREYLKEYQKKVQERIPTIDRVIGELKDISPFRDVREHEIDYLKGKGYDRVYYEKDVAKESGLGLESFRLDPHTNVITRNDIIFGGRISLNKIDQSLTLLKKTFNHNEKR
jgi:hypothetical protein